MKLLASSILVLSLSSSMAMAQISEKSTFQDKFSYSYGYTLAKTQEKILPTVNVKIALQAFQDYATGKKAKLSDEEMHQILTHMVNQEKSKPLLELFAEIEQNNQVGQKFLKENGKKREVQRLKSGLQVQWLESVAKKKVNQMNDYQQVSIRYEGRLIDGTIFDSSIARNEVKKFEMTQLISGLQQGINLMSVGEKARFFIPAHLAYGDIGAGVIPSASVLIFDVELVEVH
ncbi:FKBP-type peptidyl-prolyl cis-trans isomerase [Moraxella sp. ZY210820]|uniref:FKBP-type peptidyl-prolyl cis-trans isomerase n=1 Tax=unclassified Moraxella TaxID=2685852 RepID=UPI00272FDB59|nr:FKBP-type peptidyl-prolyl cis-trans isomerase [Moraxella sp. ZY210820]WLF84173.1 FKBP-type peptidyl-prolyl cis-trans isomerase [Moraxella sp. ZY210820]